MSEPLYVTLNVGGFQYKIKRSVLLQFPDSFFGKMLGSVWKESSDAIVEIQRDGELFKFVYEYMFYGKLPRNEFGISLLREESLLKEVMEEAEFYQLPGLVKECDGLLHTCEAEQRVKHYATMLDEIEKVKSTVRRGGKTIVYEETGPDSLLALLRSNPFAPAWVNGTLSDDCNPNIFMSTTVQNVNAEIIAAAQPSPFGRGSETVLDKNVRDSMEIPASQLCDLTEIVNRLDISALAPSMNLTLKPYKLVVYKEGGHFHGHRDTVRDKRHIGTLVLILNSEYGGGELELCHGKQTLVVTGALNWVAMYGDCVHTIRPVTSGSRVSLIFDIWNESDGLTSPSQKRSSSEMLENDDTTALPSALRKKNPVSEKVEDDEDEDDDDKEGDAEMDEDGDDSEEDEDKNVEDNNEDDDDDDEEDYEDDWDYGFWPDAQVNTRFWRRKGSTQAGSKAVSKGTRTLGISAVWNRIYEALDKELNKHKTVSICLEHLYPACQANPDFLKGEDAKLYQMLKDNYSLAVTAITIARTTSDDNGESFGYKEFGSDQLLDANNNVVFVPNAMSKNSVLYYLAGSEYTGNESQDQELVYLVAALVVRKK